MRSIKISSSGAACILKASSMLKEQVRTHGHGHSHGAPAFERRPRGGANGGSSSVSNKNRNVDSPHSHGYLNGCCHGHSHGQHYDIDIGGANDFGAEGNHAPVLYTKPGELEAHVRGENLKACRRVTMVGAGTNLTYCFLKISLGSQGGSVALLADGVHALVDFGADLISFFSVHVTHRKYARARFPFGLGRFETLASIFIAVLLLSTGTALLLSAMDRVSEQVYAFLGWYEKKTSSVVPIDGAVTPELLEKETTCEVPGCHHNHKHNSLGIFGALACDHDDDFVLMETDASGNTKLLWPMIAVSVSCFFVKQGMYRWARKVGEKAGSRIIVANAYHHRADSWTSGIALVGVAGQVAGIPFLDGVAGALVSGLILRTGAFLMRNSVLELFDFQNSDVRCLAEQIRHNITDNYKESIPNLIGLYSTRHGHQYSLNATMLVRSGNMTDLQNLCRAQRTLERVARRENKVNLSNVALTLHEIEPDRPISADALAKYPLKAEVETLSEALAALKAYKPVHLLKKQEVKEAKASSDAAPVDGAAAAASPADGNAKQGLTSFEPFHDANEDQAEVDHKMYHRRRRVVNLFSVLEDFYGSELVPLDSIKVNWATNEIDVKAIFDMEQSAKKQNHATHHRLEMLQEDLESVCGSLGFALVK